ncbi:hypothetical protein [Nonomuraea sp. CA-141351]|uniref:hypothetical protein n=1 Tax=Nonomuraea sp. CA-141351 TaxID=3239996 RepID=UPI003D8E3331
MAQIIAEVSRTFNEYLLLPNRTRIDCSPAAAVLQVKNFKAGFVTSDSLVNGVVRGGVDDCPESAGHPQTDPASAG